MKWLKYTYRTVVTYGVDENGNTIEREVFTEMYVPDNENGRAIAEKEAYGEITPYDDGQPDPAETPTQLDIIEAQVTYTAMMTDTLLEA